MKGLASTAYLGSSGLGVYRISEQKFPFGKHLYK